MSLEKNVPEIRFKEFSGEWMEHNLGELIDIRSAARVHKEQWTETGVPFFRTSDVVSIYKGQENAKAFISYDVYKELTGKIGKVSSGDLLVTGGGSIGIPFLVPNDEPLYFKDADLLWFKNDQKFDGYYLYTFLFSKAFKKYIKSISHIGTIAHYTIEQAKATPIKKCERAEQTAIGNTFQKLDSLINQHQQKHDKLSSIKKAMLDKMFPKQGENIPEIRFKGFSGEWEEKELGELAEIVRGASPRPIDDPKWFDKSSTVGWLRIRDVTEQDGRIYVLEQRISKLGQEKTRVLFEPHLLLSIAASVGKPVINYVETGVHDGFLIFKKPLFELEFMYQWLKSFQEAWQQYGQPGSQVNLNSDIVKGQVVCIPSNAEQVAIGNYFQKLDALINQHQQQIIKLNNIKQACLSKMFV
ncbi:restriction endonuclease subunit S [Vibrio parahaemolyticus]|uniref:restriction endonuclease subunit S n=1 Tax=Vibrio parahaemolyticus TaxID=670 RepID=UPI0003ED8DFC|nr:restriction endonuclease subunit S [Vibrio parahaemolyticus]AHI98681.1 Type I restriction-modification system, specificity subunit S [Vibrio parahaemolyticus UCM-V493]